MGNGNLRVRAQTSLNRAKAGQTPLRWDVLLGGAAALILVSVARLHYFVPGMAAIRPAMLSTLVAIVALAAGQKGARRIEHLATPLGRLMAGFILWAVLTAPFAIYPGHSVRYLLNGFLREAVVALVVSASVRDVTDLSRLLKVYGYGVIAFSVFAAGTGARNIGVGGYDANDSAMFVVSGVPLIFFFLFRARTVLGRAIFAVGLATAASAIVLSESRGGFLALVAVTGYSLFFLKGIKRSMRVGVVLVGAVLVVFNASGDFWARMRTIGSSTDYNVTSYTGREQIWKRGMGYMFHHPLTGVGIDDFTTAEGWNPTAQAMAARGKGVKWSAAHSIWVQTGAELGIPGLLALFGLFFMSIKVLWTADRLASSTRWKSARELQKLGELGRPLIGVLLGAAVAGTFLANAYSSLLWLPFALALSVDKLGRLKEKELIRQARRMRSSVSRGGTAPQRSPRPASVQSSMRRGGRWSGT